MINKAKLQNNAIQFQNEVIALVADGHTYLEALTEYQMEHGLDESAVVSLLNKSKPIMANLTAECSDHNLIATNKLVRKLSKR